ncbi:hypothetical protein F5B22DRAFT_650194 [Xylaria bambusicola]|uniref:uncharacterized protein n=1 Tax=Xylaria bambusicola TaxID=326684 RepID=UPI002007A756|nr:uncharacterized protein F5B22DRAFT_650194 [Xylaria bambusicola]KAI0508338.1 hypothetical protein F5B22DRAFT_650194 [Xylaria bambusicola]
MMDNEQPPSSLIRTPTLESGTPFSRRSLGRLGGLLIQEFASEFRPRNNEDQDAVETILAREAESVEPLIDTSARASTHHKIALTLQLEYSHFKNRDAGVINRTSALGNIFQGRPPHKRNPAFSCDELLSHWRFAAPQPSSCEAAQNTAKVKRTKVENNDKVTDWMCRIARELVNNDNGSSLQLISLAEQPNRGDVVCFFSFWRYTVATFRGRVDTLHLFPTWLLEILVAHCWNFNLTPWWSAPPVESAQVRPKPDILPSKRALKTSTTQSSPFDMAYWGKDKKRPGNLDPTRGDNEIFLCWQDTCATYTSDTAVYIWEPQNSIPMCQHAKVVVSSSKTHAGCEEVRLIIAFGTCRAHTLFTKRRDATIELDVPSQADHQAQQWSPWREMVLSLCCVFEVLISDTWEFINKCHDESERVQLLGRRSPSTSKLRFSLHLEDCCKVTQRRIRHDLKVFHHFTRWINQSDRSRHSNASLQSRLDILKKDMEFLENELKKLQATLKENQKIMRDHFQLAQDLRVFRITILAAIFLPLSFTTSFFGMNLNPNVVEGPLGFTNLTNITLDTVPTDLRASTEALVSIIGSSSNLNFSWLVFGVTAGALLLTLPVSLFVGAVVRFLVVWAKDHIVYWRVIAVVGVVIFAFFSIGGLYLRDFLGFYILYIITNSFLTIAFTWRAYSGWRLNDRPIIWTSLASLTLVTFLVNILALRDVPLLIFPWLYGLLLWVVPWWHQNRRLRGD